MNLSRDEKQALQELYDTMNGYITLLSDEIGKNAAFLGVHRIYADIETIKSGEQFRKKIASLKEELKGIIEP